MTKTQRKAQRSKEWKEVNGWGLTPAQRTQRTINRAEQAIAEATAAGRDTSILVDLLNDVKAQAN